MTDETQKIVEALLLVGFKQPYNSPYTLEYEGYQLKLSKDETLSRVFLKIISMGKILNAWEVKRVLQIV